MLGFTVVNLTCLKCCAIFKQNFLTAVELHTFITAIYAIYEGLSILV